MNNRDNETRRYEELNRTAIRNATVIFGNEFDMCAPIDLPSSNYHVNEYIVNRSFPGLTSAEAAGLYVSCCAPIKPSRVLIRLSDASADPEFDRAFIALVSVIGHDVEIGVIAGENEEINAHLKALCESCRCEFCDPKAPGCDLDTLCYLYGSGLKSRVSLNTLVRMLYCRDEAAYTAGVKAKAKHGFASLFRFAEAK